jgi:hypothetical protein
VAAIVVVKPYGRHCYRRITALLQKAGWQNGKDRMQRIFVRSMQPLVALRGTPLIHQAARLPFAHAVLLTRVPHCRPTSLRA